MKFLLIIALSGLLLAQGPSLSHVKHLDDGSDIVTVGGEARMAITLAMATQFKKDQATLHELQSVEIPKLNDKLTLCTQNVQDERVRVAKAEERYEGQLLSNNECFALLRKGGGKLGRLLDNPYFRVLEDGVKTGVQIATCR